MAIKSFRDLLVWQKAMDIAVRTYTLTRKLPIEERYGLASQMQRAAVSIPSNIAEGCQRNNRNEFRQFCGVAYGSAAELETQLLLANRLYQLPIEGEISLLAEIQKMLRQLIHKLTTKN